MDKKVGVYQLAKILKVSHTSIYTWVSDKNMPHTKEYLGLREVLKFNADKCVEWLNEQR